MQIRWEATQQLSLGSKLVSMGIENRCICKQFFGQRRFETSFTMKSRFIAGIAMIIVMIMSILGPLVSSYGPVVILPRKCIGNPYDRDAILDMALFETLFSMNPLLIVAVGIMIIGAPMIKDIKSMGSDPAAEPQFKFQMALV